MAEPHERVPAAVRERLLAALSQRRLSDLVPADPRIVLCGSVAQNDNVGVCAVFQGHLFNGSGLRRALTEAGHPLRRESAAQIVAQGYEQWGIDGLLERLDGDFCFALWDARARTAHLARDPLGAQSLWYIDRYRRLAFSSAFKCLLRTGLLNGRIDEVALWGYLRYQFTSGERTLLAGVRELPPGHHLQWREGIVTVRRYWDMADASSRRSPDAAPPPEILRELLASTVAKQAEGAASIGCLLGDGSGSAILAALLAKRAPLKTFSLSFASDPPDETARALEGFARGLGVAHEFVRLDEAAILRWVSGGGPWQGDQPIADQTALPLYFLSQQVGGQVSRIFSAAGADELFAGHAFYRARSPRFPMEQFRAGIADSAAAITSLMATLDATRRLGVLTLQPGDGGMSPYTGRPYAFRDDFLWGLLHPERRPDGRRLSEFLAKIEGDPVAGKRELTGLRAAQYIESKLWVGRNLLPRLRETSGEAQRVPFLHPNVAAFAFGLPEESLIGAETGSGLLRQVLHDILPGNCFPRRPVDVPYPLNRWLRGELRSLVHDTLDTLRALGAFDPAMLRFLVEDPEPLSPGLAQCIWSLLLFGQWHERVRREIAESNTELQAVNQCCVPAAETSATSDAFPACDIVIPVYEGIALVRDLLRSIENYTDPAVTPYHVWLIDDGSEPATFARLEELAGGRPRLTLLRNEKNLGFVATANRGLETGAAPLVLLLNSDTLVTPGWLERIVRCAMSDDRIALVNPLSNRSDNLSVELPPGLGLETIAARVAEASPTYPDIVTVVGFCLLIKRKYVRWLGGLDPVFGIGYCEESDLHMRFCQNGLRAVLADDAYVYHMGNGSFGAAWQERYQVNRKVFDSRWDEEYWRDLKSLQRAAPIERIQSRLLENTVPLRDYREDILEAIEEVVGKPQWTADLPVADYSFSKRRWKRFVHCQSRLLLRRRHNGDDREVFFPSAPYVRRLPRPKQLRITFLLYGLESSGGILSIVQLAREWLLAGHDVQLVTTIPHASNLWPERVNLPCQPLIYPSADRLVRDFPASDIVIPTFWLTAYDWLPRLKEQHKFRSVYYVQDYEAWFYPDHHPDRQRVIDTLGMTDERVVKSQWLADLLAAHRQSSVQIHQGIDLDIFYPRARREQPRPRVLACARPHEPRRGFSNLIGIYERLHNARPDVELCLYGCSDSDLKHFDLPFPYTNFQRIYDLNRVARLQTDCDILLDPSLYQALGMPGIEAMACGTATVLPNIGGIHEYAIDGKNTLLVSPADERAAVAAIIRLLDDGELRCALVRNGFDQPPRFCHRHEARLHLALYERLLRDEPTSMHTLTAAG